MIRSNLQGFMTEKKKTIGSLLWMDLASEPLVALYTLMPFLLRKEIGSSMLQISLFLTLRPVLSLFSFYWSAYLKEGKSQLIVNCVSASVLAYLPFLFFPFLEGFWLLFLASAMYQLFSKAAIPSLIEVLKRKLSKSVREKTFSSLYVLKFVECGVLGIVFGGLLDAKVLDWSWLFFYAGMLGLSSLVFFSLLKVPPLEEEEKEHQPFCLIRPWKESFRLVASQWDFGYFQRVFMVGGSALMLMLPAASSYYADSLQLSYTDITVARFVFMAIGVAASSMFWTKGLSKVPLLRLTVGTLFGFGLFPLSLLIASWHVSFVYLAFFIYGVAQAGSHVIWNLSGTFFAGEGSSSPYTRANLLMHALRGAVMPLLGGVLCDLVGAVPVLFLGMAICFMGGVWLWNGLRERDLALPNS